jgi:sec-independent protein translocase protein TatA
MGLSWSHILIVLVLFVLLFGRGKISELMGDVAQGIKSFKKGMAEDEDTAAAEEPKVIEHKAPKPNTKTASRDKDPGLTRASRKSSKRGAKPRICSTSVGRSFSSSPWSPSWWSGRRTCPS